MQKFVLVAFRILISDKIYTINVKHHMSERSTLQNSAKQLFSKQWGV